MTRFLLFFFILLFTFSCNTERYYKSLWHSTSKGAPANVFQQEDALTMKVSNNEKTLFIEIQSTSPATIEKVHKLGLSLWIGKGASPRKSFGIHYPLPYKDCKNKVALEGFSEANLIPFATTELSSMQISATFVQDAMHYKLQIPLTKLQLSNEDVFTIQIGSFEAGKEEYLSSLTSEQEIERRLDKYKVHTKYQHNKNELYSFFKIFQLAKMPNKNL